VVDSITGIAWKEVRIVGEANHAGTTPMHMRHDAGLAAAHLITFLPELADGMGQGQRATCGSLTLLPGTINVIPGTAQMTVDLRNHDDDQLRQSELRLSDFLKELARRDEVSIQIRQLARVSPVHCSREVTGEIELACGHLHHSHQRIASGAGHDAQIMAHVCPTAMIFVPSRNGISHSSREYTSPAALSAGANVLLHTVLRLAA